MSVIIPVIQTAEPEIPLASDRSMCYVTCMASLYTRKTFRQRRALRIVAGAVMNAAHAHPQYGIDEKIARSIAKRAVGTLTAEWPVLALVDERLASDHEQP